MKRISKNLYQHENGTFYTLHRVGSRQFKKSLGTKDKGEAKRLQRQQRLQAVTGNGNGSLPIPDPTAIERPSFSRAVELHEANTVFGSKSTARISV